MIVEETDAFGVTFHSFLYVFIHPNHVLCVYPKQQTNNFFMYVAALLCMLIVFDVKLGFIYIMWITVETPFLDIRFYPPKSLTLGNTGSCLALSQRSVVTRILSLDLALDAKLSLNYFHSPEHHWVIPASTTHFGLTQL